MVAYTEQRCAAIVNEADEHSHCRNVLLLSSVGSCSQASGSTSLHAGKSYLEYPTVSRVLRRFREEFGGLDPEYFADMLALMGDASDNVPGVKGLGPKTALPLLLQFGTVEALLDRVDEVCVSCGIAAAQ